MTQETIDGQVLYKGRFVSRKHFRAFVYSSTALKLCNSYDEYQKLVSSGIWWSDKPTEEALDNVVPIKKRGRKCQNQVKA